MPKPETERSLAHRFAYHAPKNLEIADKHQMIRRSMLGAAMDVMSLTPASREQSLAFTKLEEAMYWANAAIARISNYEEDLD